MKSIRKIIVAFCLLPVLQFSVGISQDKKITYLSDLENEVLIELNSARTNPSAYAEYLEQLKPYYVGRYFKRPGKLDILTTEGVGALEEAIRFLRRTKPLSPLSISRGMSLGAQDHVKDQGKAGTTGHYGSDGSKSWDRIMRYGTWQITAGENIAYGRENARDIVIGLITDDGVPDRGHRTNMFNPAFHVVGIACGKHTTYGWMCVMTFAGGFIENRLVK